MNYYKIENWIKKIEILPKVKEPIIKTNSDAYFRKYSMGSSGLLKCLGSSVLLFILFIVIKSFSAREPMLLAYVFISSIKTIDPIGINNIVNNKLCLRYILKLKKKNKTTTTNYCDKSLKKIFFVNLPWELQQLIL